MTPTSITIRTDDATGAVAITAAPLAGCTLRQVESLPTGPGKLLWQPDDPAHPEGPGKLVRVVQPAPVPATISPAQLEEWLIRAGKLDAVHSALAAIADPTERQVMQAWYDKATVIERGNAKVAALAQALGMSSDDVDAAFRAAAAF